MQKRTLGNVARMATLGILVTLPGWTLGLSGKSAMGQATCRAPLPAPCTADGVCIPSRESWGWHQSRWRPWPGDNALMQPTATGEQALTKESLPGFLRPPADQEDLRIRAKKDGDQSESPEGSTPPVPNSEVPSNEAPDGAMPSGETQGRTAPNPSPVVHVMPVMPDANHEPNRTQGVVLRLPAADGIPHPSMIKAANTATNTIKQISNGLVQPGSAPEDAPPALPASLERIAAQRRTTLPADDRPMAIQSSAPVGIIQDRRVNPARWHQPTSIQLINPAAALAEDRDGRPLRQAIYYEATGPGSRQKKGL